jgi:hypothetical protein
VWVEQKKGGRGLWEKPPSSSPQHKQNKGERPVRGGSGSCGRRPSLARRRPGVGGQRKEVEGNAFLSSSWAGTTSGRRSTAAGGM